MEGMKTAPENGDFDIKKWAQLLQSAGSHDEMTQNNG
jgi:hypothetical protein